MWVLIPRPLGRTCRPLAQIPRSLLRGVRFITRQAVRGGLPAQELPVPEAVALGFPASGVAASQPLAPEVAAWGAASGAAAQDTGLDRAAARDTVERHIEAAEPER